MAAKPVQFREFASIDFDSAVNYYLAEAGQDIALRFVDAVEAAVRRAGKNPKLGSLRYAYELTIPDLRTMPVGRFPYVIFYAERVEVMDMWRLLHTSRDIPATLQDGSTS